MVLEQQKSQSWYVTKFEKYQGKVHERKHHTTRLAPVPSEPMCGVGKGILLSLGGGLGLESLAPLGASAVSLCHRSSGLETASESFKELTLGPSPHLPALYLGYSRADSEDLEDGILLSLKKTPAAAWKDLTNRMPTAVSLSQDKCQMISLEGCSWSSQSHGDVGVARDWGERRWGISGLMGAEFQLGKTRKF